MPKDSAVYRLLNNRYVLTKCLFSGPVGQVYLARAVRAADRGISGEVLVHSIPSGMLEYTRLSSRFHFLRRCCDAMDDAELLPVLDCGWLDGTACFVLRKPSAWSISLLAGRDAVGSRLHQQALLIAERLHERGLIPGADLHPNWFLVTSEGELRVPGTVLLPELAAFAADAPQVSGPRPLRQRRHWVPLLMLLVSLGSMAMVAGWVWYRFGAGMEAMLFAGKPPPTAAAADTQPLSGDSRIAEVSEAGDTAGRVVPEVPLLAGQAGSVSLLEREHPADQVLPAVPEAPAAPSAPHLVPPVSGIGSESGTLLLQPPVVPVSVEVADAGHAVMPAEAVFPPAASAEDRSAVPAAVERSTKVVSPTPAPVTASVEQPPKPVKADASPEPVPKPAPVSKVVPAPAEAVQPPVDVSRLRAAGMNRDQLIRKANEAIRQGRLGEYPGWGALYFIRLLRRIDPSHLQVRYLARDVATRYHDRARNQIRAGARKQAARSLWVAHQVIQEFNLVQLNPAQALLRRRLAE